MNILLVSATGLEIAPFLKAIGAETDGSIISTHTYKNHTIDVLFTGVGMAQTSFYLGKYLNKNYDLAINAGICGSFNRFMKLGDVICINEDYFADLGAEDDEKFLSVLELNLPGAYYVRNENAFKNELVQDLKTARGITVNTTHGNEASIKKLTSRLQADVESMEGAAFLWACNQTKVKCVQVRSISNYVEKRDRNKWEIKLAVNNLNDLLLKLVSSI
ncbi:MAG: futalosine hydrolase [Bacteroidia bacterium]